MNQTSLRLGQLFDDAQLLTMMKIVVVFMILVGVVASLSTVCVDPAKQICETYSGAIASCTVLEEIARLIALHYSALSVTLPQDCTDPLLGEVDSGVYLIQPLDQGPPIDVYCDMETDFGGWTVFQRRQDGSVDFYLDWEDYRQGFGDLTGEFWLGNDNIHRIISLGEYKLRIDMTDFDDNSAYAAYNTFGFGSSSESYAMHVADYSGTAGDSLTRKHNTLPFSTRDHDLDRISQNCAELYHGAWWYSNCHISNLNGNYLGEGIMEFGTGVMWRTWKGMSYSLKTSEMKIKRKN